MSIGKRMLSLLLAMVMCFSLVNIPGIAWADKGEGSDTVAGSTEGQETPKASEVPEEPAAESVEPAPEPKEPTSEPETAPEASPDDGEPEEEPKITADVQKPDEETATKPAMASSSNPSITVTNVTAADTVITFTVDVDIPYEQGTEFTYGIGLAAPDGIMLYGKDNETTVNTAVDESREIVFRGLIPGITYTYYTYVYSNTYENVGNDITVSTTSGDEGVNYVSMQESFSSLLVNDYEIVKFTAPWTGYYEYSRSGNGIISVYDKDVHSLYSTDSYYLEAGDPLWLRLYNMSQTDPLTVEVSAGSDPGQQFAASAVTGTASVTCNSATLSGTYSISNPGSEIYYPAVDIEFDPDGDGDYEDLIMQCGIEFSGNVTDQAESFVEPALFPETSYRFRAFIEDGNYNETAYYGEWVEFSTSADDGTSIPALTSGVEQQLEGTGYSLYKYTADSDGIYTVNVSGNGACRVLDSGTTFLTSAGSLNFTLEENESIYLRCETWDANDLLKLSVSLKSGIDTTGMAASSGSVTQKGNGIVNLSGTFDVPYNADDPYHYGIYVYKGGELVSGSSYIAETALENVEYTDDFALVPGVSYTFKAEISSITQGEGRTAVFSSSPQAFSVDASDTLPQIATDSPQTIPATNTTYIFTANSTGSYILSSTNDGMVYIYGSNGRSKGILLSFQPSVQLALEAGEEIYLCGMSYNPSSPMTVTISKSGTAVTDFAASLTPAENITDTSASISATFSIPYTPDTEYSYGVEIYEEGNDSPVDGRGYVTSSEINNVTRTFTFSGLKQNTHYTYKAFIRNPVTYEDIVTADGGEGFVTSVAVSETNFPDANFRSYVSGNCDTDGDGYLSEAEIADVTVINIFISSISDLTGIEYFTELEQLWCHQNQLTTLDVSNNTALTRLACNENQLTSLNVSGNTALEYLQCSNNLLATIDISKNTALTQLACSNNLLTDLDLNKNTALTDLWCDSNQLTNLDLSNNTALEYLELYNNRLTSLDLSNNPALTMLHCPQNQLTSLNVSNNTLLNHIDCSNNLLTALNVSSNTALENLFFSNNQLTSIDVSSNTGLIRLFCDNNLITNIDVSNNPLMENFFCNNNRLADLDLSENAALKILNCSNNLLTSLDLSANTALTELHCSENNLTSLDLSSNSALTTFECTGNAFAVTEDQSNQFDLSALPGFDVSKTSDWTGGTVDGNILTFNSDTVTYTYDVGNSSITNPTFTLTTTLNNTPVTGVSLNKTKAVIGIGETLQLTATVSPVNASNQSVVWTSSDATVATVDENGLVTGVATGSSIITATTEDGGYSETCVVAVGRSGTWGNLTWTLDNEGLLTISGSGAMNDFSYDSTDAWRAYTSDIKSAVIEDGITNIGDYAFWNCKALTNVIIPNGVTSIGVNSFGYCTSMEIITIPDSVKTISSGAFKSSGLTNVTIPSNVTELSEGLFNNCYSLTEITIPTGMITICDYAFLGCVGLTSLTIPDSVKSIGVDAFGGCSSLTNVVLPESITSIGSQAFDHCSGLTSVEILSPVTSIDYHTFAYCSNLTEIALPEGITDIGEGAFQGCSGITNFFIPASVSYISYHAFENCESLTEVIYGGSQVQWNRVRILNDNDPLLNASIVFSSYTISYDANGGENAPEEQTEKIGTLIVLTDIVPTRTDYEFLGWSTDAQATEAEYLPGAEYITEGDVTLFAIWGENIIPGIAIDETNFPDANFRSYISNNYDTDGDGYLIDDEIANVVSIDNGAYWNSDYTELIEPENKFADLTGIEHFTNLSYLNVVGNGLTAINVSSNTALTELICWNNSLTSLDVSNNELLNTLLCSGNNISGLDVSNNTALTALVCGNNNLSTLDVSRNTHLTSLQCYGNNLTELDLSKNTELTLLRCWGNRLTSLDLSNNTELTQLQCDSNEYYVTVDDFNHFDLSTLEGFDVSKASDWTGGTVTGTVLTFTSDTVSYTYDIGNSNVDNPAFTLTTTLNDISVPVVGVSLDRTGATLTVGETVQINAVITPSNATNQELIWTSSNEDVATVDSTGLVTGVATGKANITAETSDGGFTAVCETIVKAEWNATVTAEKILSGSAVISWTAWDYSNIAGYTVYRDGAEIGRVTEPSYTDRGLTTGQEYTYSIVGYATDGIITNGNEITVTPILPDVTDIRSDDENNTVSPVLNKLYFYVADSGNLDPLGGELPSVKAYYIRSGAMTFIGEPVHDPDLDRDAYRVYVLNWDISSVNSGDYEILCSFSDADGGRDSYSETFTVAKDIPGKIKTITTVSDVDRININWSISLEADTTVYRLYRKTGENGAFTRLTQINSRDTRTYADTDVTTENVYYYYVVGVNAFGLEGEPSDIVGATLGEDTAIPRVTKITPPNGTVLSGIATIGLKAEDNVGVVSSKLLYAVGNSEEWTEFAISAENDNPALFSTELDTTAIADGTIKIKGIAYDAAGNESSPVTYTFTVDNSGPSKVSGLSYTGTDVTITLSWNDVPEEDIDSFKVEQKNGDGTYTKLADVTKTLGYNVYDLIPETDYIFRVTAVDLYGNEGEPSDDLTAVTSADTTAPVVTRISPDAGYYTDSIDIKITATDEYGIAGITVQTSEDAYSWTDVYTQSYDGAVRSRTLNYTLNIDSTFEGKIFVRGIATDISGNESSSGIYAPYNQYVIDRTAPAAPETVTATGYVGYIEIAWIQGSENDLGKYSVYRSTSEDGEYTCIGSGIAATSFIDRNADDGVTYYYKVRVNDRIGNESEFSSAVYSMCASDTEAPQIISIYPETGRELGAAQNTVSVLAADNKAVSGIEIEYSHDGINYSALAARPTADGRSMRSETEFPADEFDDGETVYIRTRATDLAGNTGDYSEAEYTIDLTAPAVDSVSAVLDGKQIRVSWSGNDEEDLAGYIIYRKIGENGILNKFATRQAVSGQTVYECNDINLPNRAVTCFYIIEAKDKCGNSALYTSDGTDSPAAVVLDEATVEERLLAPEAVISCDAVMEAGAEYRIDGSHSSDDKKIVSYEFDFGDGSAVSTEIKPVHTYTETGIYTVTLTVTDEDGITATAAKEITVNDSSLIGTAKIHIVDQDGNSVSGAPVYFDLGDSERMTVKYTDSNGYAEFTAEAGRHAIGCVISDNEWLPAKKEVVISAGVETSTYLTLVKHKLVEGTFEINRMTFEEIEAAGIDTSVPENQNIVKVNVRLTYSDAEIDMSFNCNGLTGGGPLSPGSTNISIVNTDPDPEDPDEDEGDSDSTNKPSAPDSNKQSRTYSPIVFFPGGRADKATIAIIDMPVEASFLKEFFDVRLHILNNASSEFSMDDNIITLNVPDGLTVMDTENSESSNVVLVDSIQGQTTKSINWIMRGDREGEYMISADYSGILSDFNTAVNTTFEASKPMKVFGTSAVKLIVEVDRSIKYDSLYFNLSLMNVSDIDVYKPSVDVSNNIISCYQQNYKKKFIGYELDSSQQEANVRHYNTVVRNIYGFEQAIGSDASLTTLGPGEVFTKKYAAYNIADADNSMLYIRESLVEAVRSVSGSAGIDVVILVVDMDLFSTEDAKEKLYLLNQNGSNRDAFNYILDNDNFFYIYESSRRDDSVINTVAEGSYEVASAILNLDFYHNRDELSEITQKTVAQLLSDESAQEIVNRNAESKALDKTKKILDMFVAALETPEDKTNALAVINDIEKDANKMRKLTEALNEGGAEGFTQRLMTLCATTSIAPLINYNFIKDHVFETEEYTGELTKALGGLSDVAGKLDEVYSDWKKAEEITDRLIQIEAAQDEAIYLLDTLIYYTEPTVKLPSKQVMYSMGGPAAAELIQLINDGVQKETPIHEELISIRQKMVDKKNSQWNNFIGLLGESVAGEVGQEAVKKILSAADLEFGYSGFDLYSFIKAVFNGADYLFGWGDTLTDRHVLRVNAVLSHSLQTAVYDGKKFVSGYSDKVEADAVNTLKDIKYLTKMRLLGEQAFLQTVQDKVDRDKDPEYETEMLRTVNAAFGTSYNSLEDYVNEKSETVLRSRDDMFGTYHENLDLAAAPEVTIDYTAETTAERFGDDYEFSYDGENWYLLVGEQTISLEPGNIPRQLWIRLKASAENMAGNTRKLLIPARPTILGDITAGFVGSKYYVSGLEPGTYSYAFVDTESVETFEGTFTAETGINTVILPAFSRNNFLALQKEATEDSFKSNIRFVPTSQDRWIVSVSSRINGTDSSVANLSGGGRYFTGESAVLNAPQVNGYTFLGWFEKEDDLDYSGSTALFPSNAVVIESVENRISLVAVYEKKAAEELSVNVSGTGYTLKINGGTALENPGTVYAYAGDVITLEATNERFKAWVNESGKTMAGSAKYSFTVTESTTVYLKTDGSSTSTVSWKSAYGQFLKSGTFTEITKNDFPKATSRTGYDFIGWMIEGTSYTDTATTIAAVNTAIANGETYVVLIPVYELVKERASVSVYVDGQISEDLSKDDLAIGSTMTLRAPEIDGRTFYGWQNSNGELLSTGKDYFIIIRVPGATAYYAVYDDSDSANFEEKPIIALDSLIKRATDGSVEISGTATRSVPEGYTLVEQGMLWSKTVEGATEDSFVIGADGVNKFKSSNTSPDGVFTLNVKVSTSAVVTMRGYMILQSNDDEEGKLVVYYSNVEDLKYRA